MAEPAEEDEQRLSRMLSEAIRSADGIAAASYAQESSRVQGMTSYLLRHGVQLPPAPEPPEAEPQERYRADGNGVFDDSKPHTGCFIITHGTDRREWAAQIARLLNLDAKYEDGIEAEVERLRSGILDSTGEAAAAEARRDEARERAEKAERELAELRASIKWWEDWSNELTTYMPEEYDGDEAQEALTVKYLKGLAGWPTEVPTPDDATGRTDTATDEPMSRHEIDVMWKNVYKRENDRLRARPAAPTVTAEMVQAAYATVADPVALEPMDWVEVADALNRLLAEQGGEG